jgi:hypothetical protein
MKKIAVISNIKKKRYLINILVFFAAIFLFSSLRQAKEITVSMDGDNLRISYPSNSMFVIKNVDICSINLINQVDLGTFVQGVNTEENQFGTWENESFGRYYLAAKSGISQYIVIKIAMDTYVFNFESNDATENFYTAYQEILQGSVP